MSDRHTASERTLWHLEVSPGTSEGVFAYDGADGPPSAPGDGSSTLHQAEDMQNWGEACGQDRKGPSATRVAQSARHEQGSAEPPPVHRILEALLFASHVPVSLERAREAIPALDPHTFSAALRQLQLAYRRQNRPYRIVRYKHGYTLELTAQGQRWAAALFRRGPRAVRISQSTLEVLAAIAYRQPIRKQTLDALRKRESAAALRQLQALGWVTTQPAAYGQVAYVTTPRFLRHFRLSSLDDLPQVADWQCI